MPPTPALPGRSESAPPPKDNGRERRRWARALAEMPITLVGPEGSSEARVRDVSRAGVCLFLDRPVPLMTVLGVAFDIATPVGRTRVQAHGAVVRCERIAKAVDHWEIAVFLHDMGESDRHALEEFVALRGGSL
ncbi:MAG: PilZ domain-containing protein [Planctomycetota bacterium]|nr:PilZ domain-containing protein [Planctomycetota bacterium]